MNILPALLKAAGITNMRFQNAIAQGNLHVVRSLIDKVDINVSSNNGSTALIVASQKGHQDIVSLLLDHSSVNVNEVDSNGSTALMEAADQGHGEIVSMLLNCPSVNVNAACVGWTALRWASHNGDKDIVELLLDRSDIKVNACNPQGLTSLILAAAQGHKEIVLMLLDHPDISVNAVCNKGTTALIQATDKGRTEIALLLLDRWELNINVTSTCGYTALIWACEKGHEEIVASLVNPLRPTRDERALAVIAGLDFETKTISRHVIAKHRRKQKKGFLSLSTPVLISIMRYLGTMKVNVNAKDFHDDSALVLAILKGHTGIVKLLLQDPDIDIYVKKGMVDVFLADRGYHGIANLLLDHERSKT